MGDSANVRHLTSENLGSSGLMDFNTTPERTVTSNELLGLDHRRLFHAAVYLQRRLFHTAVYSQRRLYVPDVYLRAPMICWV